MTQRSRPPSRLLGQNILTNMPSRANKNTLWVMLIGVLVGFFGVFIYGYLNASIGYAIGVAGSSLRGSVSLAISVSQTEKTQPDAKAESAIPEAEEKELSINEIPKEEPELEIDRSVCKKRYRDAIDANDAEIGREYSPDKSE